MADFYEELVEGDIHIRDKYQFELKSEYSARGSSDNNTYTLEFFFFVPGALQINRETYSKRQFYLDQTNLIRLKTPGYSFAELIDPHQPQSPLYRITAMHQQESQVDQAQVADELKLYANIVRSAVKKRVKDLVVSVKEAQDTPALAAEAVKVEEFCGEAKNLRESFLAWQDQMKSHWQQGQLLEYSQYVDEFISNVTERYCAGLLQELEKRQLPALTHAQRCLVDRIAFETSHRTHRKERSPFADDPERSFEYAVYRGGLLKKFVLEALFLSLERREPGKTLQQVAAVVAAGFAMLFYVFFLSYYSVNVLWDSTAFLVLSVLLYILKDRIKEGIKDFSSKWASGRFPDYKTIIRTPNEQLTLGYLNEYFSFLPEAHVPEDIVRLRNIRFHTELEKAKRLETVFCFKKEVTLLKQLATEGDRPYELNDIFRYNISRYLVKASDPYKEHLFYDSESQHVKTVKGPKVYHINIIIRQTRPHQAKAQTEYKRYRVILDKEGIKRIEKVE